MTAIAELGRKLLFSIGLSLPLSLPVMALDRSGLGLSPPAVFFWTAWGVAFFFLPLVRLLRVFIYAKALVEIGREEGYDLVYVLLSERFAPAPPPVPLEEVPGVLKESAEGALKALGFAGLFWGLLSGVLGALGVFLASSKGMTAFPAHALLALLAFRGGFWALGVLEARSLPPEGRTTLAPFIE